jgi:hypothetical protein
MKTLKANKRTWARQIPSQTARVFFIIASIYSAFEGFAHEKLLYL